MADKKKSSKRKTSDRTYLNPPEIKLLEESLAEWNDQPDKKSRDAFVVASVLPKIQEMNMEMFGPEKLSKDKEAKVLWERRITVSCQSSLLLTSDNLFTGNSWMVQK